MGGRKKFFNPKKASPVPQPPPQLGEPFSPFDGALEEKKKLGSCYDEVKEKKFLFFFERNVSLKVGKSIKE